MKQPLSPPPHAKIKLANFDPRYVDGDWTKEPAAVQVEENVAASAELAHRLYAENRRALLLILQGMDTSGKDGTIRKVMTGVNPQSFRITSFKQPTAEELGHDFLWRIHQPTPRHGQIGIFNRSQYEDVLIVRVHQLAPKREWTRRYDQINEFERLLADSGTTVIKCFLHISKDEQRARLQARLDDPTKRWKFNAGDLDERKLWNDYQRAYEDAISKCNTPYARWHIVPANRKWYRNLVVSTLVRQALEKLDPQFPKPAEGLEDVTVE